jgi:hypothetical protein
MGTSEVVLIMQNIISLNFFSQPIFLQGRNYKRPDLRKKIDFFFVFFKNFEE